MNKLAMVQIRDIYPNHPEKTWSYLLTESKTIDTYLAGVDTIPTSITLLPHKTARTHVMLRDSKGKFISYRDARINSEIKSAMESLTPFPKG
ncbi:hypothetical protein [Escherichia phage vB-EcoP-XT73]|uniref:Uncharacterized protein n=1 Tax=Escherichia phage vB-EcoP-XT18 TaxID=3093889 RepID=A0ABZ0S0P2_9CAUD|nr:hypothetical protein [Escherichia phage vB-EcoP-XT18]WPK41985.1 hypothetical protein [Escherichia phage vB-EcoP-XT32]WPK42064.1 hypothetical protein [Escherichia phage vB-EcoP-XT73]